ncbi:MAG TPA: hypothetical protein VEF33_05335, partial [Syntrophales bacterium]|nr:hypothetical protein [Syntrophales bacterium]
GVPDDVITRAREILNNLEKGEFDEVGMPKIARGKRSAPKDKAQLSLFMNEEDVIVNELKAMDVLNITPLEALQKLSDWKDKLC